MPGVRSIRALPVGLAFLVWCGATGPLRAQTGATPGEESNTLRGTVLNRITNEPIARVLVSSSDNRLATLTDSSGHFEFKIPPPPERKNEGANSPAGTLSEFTGMDVRRFYLSARKPGFLPEENSPGTLVNPGDKDVTIYLLPEARIVGHVTAADSDNPERFQVEIFRRQVQEGRARWVSAGTFQTWSDGQFRFSMLYPGTYKLFTHEMMDRDPLTFDPQGPMYGYPPVYYPAAANFAAGSIITLSAGATFDADLTPTRREYYPVEIALANAPAGGPLSVTVSQAGEAGPGYSLGYNPQGPAIQGFLPDGTYDVEARTFPPAGATGTTTINVKGGPATSYTMTLLPNVSIDVEMDEEFTGTNTNDQQATPSGGDLSALRRSLQMNLLPEDDFGDQQGASLSHPIGTEGEPLRIENVPPGRFWVDVNSYLGYAASVKYGETDLLRRPLVVSAGGSHDPIEVTLRDDGASVDGVIENMPGGPGTDKNTPRVYRSSRIYSGRLAPHVYLIPLPDSTGQFREIWVGPDGKFTLRQIPPGEYRVLAFDRPQPQLEYRNAEAMRKRYPAEQEIQLQAGQSVQLQLRMMSGSD